MPPSYHRKIVFAVTLGAAVGVSADAHGGVGLWLAPDGAALHPAHTTVVVAPDATATIWTVQPTITGDASLGVFVLPVPATTTLDGVRTADPTALDDLHGATSAILLGTTCEHLYPIAELDDTATGPSKSLFGRFQSRGPCGCLADTRTDPNPPWPSGWLDTGWMFAPDPPPVVREAHTPRPTTGEFEFTLADGSVPLQDQLALLGVRPSSEALAALEERLSAGERLLLSRVVFGAPPTTSALLPAIQFATPGTELRLPMRWPGTDQRATTTVLTLARSDLGRAELETLTRRAISADCLMPPESQDFAEFVDAHLVEQLGGDAETTTTWAVEGSGFAIACDPCGPSAGIAQETAQVLGLTSDLAGLYWTRIRIHEHHDAMPDDPPITFSALTSMTRMSFVRYDESLESDYPICGRGYAEEPGTCVTPEFDSGSEASAPWLGWGVLSLVAGAFARLRRGQA